MICVLIAAAFLAEQVSAPIAVKTQVEGSVINSLNGEGIRKAVVILRAHDPEHQQSYADETDGNGHFSMADVEPGEYDLSAQRPGFNFEAAGAAGAPPPSVKVEAGQQIKDVTIRLMPLGAIAGRVLDADGDPVRGVIVIALRYVYSAGKKELTNVAQVQSGNQGDFRLFGLRAGTFYLRALQIDQDPGSATASVATYYPGTLDEAHAAPVQLPAGGQLQGFDIRLQSPSTFLVRVEFAERQPLESRPDGLLHSEHGSWYGVAASSLRTENGLVFVGVPAGSYDAVLRSYGENAAYAIRHVEVVNSDVDVSSVTFLPAVQVPGSVRIEGGKFSGPIGGSEHPRISLQAELRNPLLDAASAQVKTDGSFLLKDLAPTVYEVTFLGATGLYLKALRIGDKTLSDRRIDLTVPPGPLSIVLGTDVGEVQGSVQNTKGEPLARARVTVIAYGNHLGRIDYSRFAFTDEKGEFTVKDVPPGDYKVFAWQDVPEGAPEDPEFRKPFEKQATALRMASNGHEKLQLTAVAAVR